MKFGELSFPNTVLSQGLRILNDHGYGTGALAELLWRPLSDVAFWGTTSSDFQLS